MHPVVYESSGWRYLQKTLLQSNVPLYLIYDAGLPKALISYTLNQCPVLKTAIPLEIPNAEAGKSLMGLKRLWNFWLKHQATRQSQVVVLGGGALTDAVGLAAALYKRGLRCSYIPSTLVGMVDAAIGGKTAINYQGLKNSLGLVVLPETVVIDPFYLSSLSAAQYHDGWIELCKTALVHSSSLWKKTIRCNSPKTELIQAVIQVKQKLCEQDINDQGVRQKLNYGHSLGHALEAWARKQKKAMSHGAAVGWGILLENEIAVRMKIMRADSAKEIAQALKPYLPTFKNLNPKTGDLLKFLKQDKKNQFANIQMTLLKSPGRALVGVRVPEAIIRDVLNEFPYVAG